VKKEKTNDSSACSIRAQTAKEGHTKGSSLVICALNFKTEGRGEGTCLRLIERGEKITFAGPQNGEVTCILGNK